MGIEMLRSDLNALYVEDGFQTIQDVGVAILSPLGTDWLQNLHGNEKTNRKLAEKVKNETGRSRHRLSPTCNVFYVLLVKLDNFRHERYEFANMFQDIVHLFH
jgi:hypothetical protein